MAFTVLHVIYCYNPGPPCDLVPDACYTQINALSLVAVVIVGKGRRPEGLTQNGDMVSIGKPTADQPKNTNGVRQACERSGKEW